MLFGIDSRLSAEILYCLARMGHGDEIVVVGWVRELFGVADAGRQQS